MRMQARMVHVQGVLLKLGKRHLHKPMQCRIAVLLGGMPWAQYFALPTCYQRTTRPHPLP